MLLHLVQQASETYEDVPMEPEVYTPPEDPKKARLRDLERERAAKVGGFRIKCQGWGVGAAVLAGRVLSASLLHHSIGASAH